MVHVLAVTESIDLSHRSHDALDTHPTMQHFETENVHMCTFLLQNDVHTCTFLLQNIALWDMRLLHCGICGTNRILHIQCHHMSILTSHITSNTAGCSTACSCKQQRKHKRSAFLVLCERNAPVISSFPLQIAFSCTKKTCCCLTQLIGTWEIWMKYK